MRALKLSALLLLVPAQVFAWGGYYGNHQSRKKTTLGASDPQATSVEPSTVRSLAGGGGSGLTSPALAAVSAKSTAATAVSTAPAPGSSSGFGTQVHSFADFGGSASGGSAPGSQAAPPAAPSSAQLGSLLGSLGGSGTSPAALGGAGLGGALGGGSCPANMHSLPNANGGHNCVPGAPGQ